MALESIFIFTSFDCLDDIYFMLNEAVLLNSDKMANPSAEISKIIVKNWVYGEVNFLQKHVIRIS